MEATRVIQRAAWGLGKYQEEIPNPQVSYIIIIKHEHQLLTV